MGEYQKTIYPGIFKYVQNTGKVVYGIDFHAAGKKFRKIIGSRLGDAKAELEKRRGLAKSGIAINEKVTFRELAQKYARLRAGNHSYEVSQKYFIGFWYQDKDGTEKWKDEILTTYFGNYKLMQISPFLIEEFKKVRKETPGKGKKGRSNTSVNRELEVMRSMLNKAVEWNFLEKSPFSRFQRSVMFDEGPGRDRFLKEDEIKALLASAPLYLKAIIRGALLTALRKGDLLNLKWEDVDLERGLLFYNEQKKRGRRQTKILNSDMIELLMQIPKKESDHIFLGPDNRPLKDVHRSFGSALKRAGISNFHFHDLRHTSASYLAMRGASMKTVQEHLGHSSLAMTQKYSHLSPDFLKTEIERLKGLCDEEPAGKKLVRLAENEENEIQPNAEITA